MDNWPQWYSNPIASSTAQPFLLWGQMALRRICNTLVSSTHSSAAQMLDLGVGNLDQALLWGRSGQKVIVSPPGTMQILFVADEASPQHSSPKWFQPPGPLQPVHSFRGPSGPHQSYLVETRTLSYPCLSGISISSEIMDATPSWAIPKERKYARYRSGHSEWKGLSHCLSKNIKIFKKVTSTIPHPIIHTAPAALKWGQSQLMQKQ